MKLWFHKMIKTDKLATAYHEAGHCVVSAIFSDKLTLNTLSINKEYLRSIHPEYNGGLHIEWKELPDENDHESGDNLILIALAGICTKTIHKKGFEFVKHNISKFQNHPDLLESEGAVDDYKIAQMYSKPISVRLQIKHQIIEWSAFCWLFELFLNPEIWDKTKTIAEELVKHKNQTLESEEINDLVESIGLKSLLIKRKGEFLSKRYPMSKETLKT